ncbi:hypothetical protein [Vibrio salinus]|uniref:hypothetical protein n=1 Tax=Vibrio salinus TaxID=2899784 RepID=UPI001E65D789|nr:hypothetical protein [Vibrio salinus]MCE0492427.1 hypothetical protein [Vibrio salinus]
MDKSQWIHNCYFKAQDAFCSAHMVSGNEPDVVYSYIYHSRRLSSYYGEGSEYCNTLLCEYFLRQTFSHFLTAIQNTSLTLTFRQLCLNSIHNLLFELKKHYQNLSGGQQKYLELKYQLQTIHI